MTSRPGRNERNCAWWARACSCWVVVPAELGRLRPPAKIDKPVAPRPAHRRNHQHQPRRTKTKFRFEVARASGLRVLAASETLALRFHERDRSLYRAQYAADHRPGAAAEIARGF